MLATRAFAIGAIADDAAKVATAHRMPDGAPLDQGQSDVDALDAIGPFCKRPAREKANRKRPFGDAVDPKARLIPMSRVSAKWFKLRRVDVGMEVHNGSF